MSSVELEDPALCRIKMECSYDGAPFHGWAKQPGLYTVQGELEAGLEKIIRRPVSTVVAGRTDAGVHASHQVVHFDLTETEFQALTRSRKHLEPLSTLVRRLNGVLKHCDGALIIRDAQCAPEGFDARFSPIWRRYRYRVSDSLATHDPRSRGYTHWHKLPLNIEMMRDEICGVQGLYDFLSFCKPRDTGTTIRELKSISVTRNDNGIIEFDLVADAFCHHMVRAIVGALMRVGDGSKPSGWVTSRLQNPARDSQMLLAPPDGLTLEEVGYPGDEMVGERAEATRAKRQS